DGAPLRRGDPVRESLRTGGKVGAMRLALLSTIWASGCLAGPYREPGAVDPDDPETPGALDPGPVPISGGTLLVSRDGKYVFASDPDADAVYRVSLEGDPV